MALSPWHIAKYLECVEVASLLSYPDISQVEAALDPEYRDNLMDAWRRKIVGAARADEIEAEIIAVRSLFSNGRDRSGNPVIEEEWQEVFPEEIDWLTCGIDDVRLAFKRHEVYRWLKSLNVADDTIPEALRVIPEPSEAEEPDQSQPADGEEMRALEALGLLTETVAKQAPKYQRNGKPNKAQIAEAMSKQAGDVYGMSKSKLARLLSDALDAWEEKRR